MALPASSSDFVTPCERRPTTRPSVLSSSKCGGSALELARDSNVRRGGARKVNRRPASNPRANRGAQVISAA